MSKTVRKSSWVKRIGLGVVLLLGILVILLLALIKVKTKPLPQGQSGEAADQLARDMLLATNDEAWQATAAVSWSFDNRQEHLWDRERHLARVRWKNLEVLIDLNTRNGRVWRKGKEVIRGTRPILEKAWAHWANDSFWLNPVSKVFDEGTRRSIVPVEPGSRGLLISYDSGGVTPGDSYLWVVDETGLPLRWKMWVKVLPIGGLASTWESWTELATGAKVSQKHDLGIKVLQLYDIKGSASLKELVPGGDPFAPLNP